MFETTLQEIFLTRQNCKMPNDFFLTVSAFLDQTTVALPGFFSELFSQKDFYSLTHKKKSSRSIFQWPRTFYGQRKIE